MGTSTETKIKRIKEGRKEWEAKVGHARRKVEMETQERILKRGSKGADSRGPIAFDW
jgi:hypothetical protein